MHGWHKTGSRKTWLTSRYSVGHIQLPYLNSIKHLLETLQTKKSLIDRTGTGLNKYIHAVASLYHRLHTADIVKLTLFHIYREEGGTPVSFNIWWFYSSIENWIGRLPTKIIWLYGKRLCIIIHPFQKMDLCFYQEH